MGASRGDGLIDLKPLCEAVKNGDVDSPTRADDTVILLGMNRPATVAEFTEFVERLGVDRRPTASKS